MFFPTLRFRSFKLHFLCFLLLPVIFKPVLGSNIDTKNPIIIHNNADGDASHFGYSLEVLKESATTPTWIFVGAPKGNSTYSQQVNIPEPGVIWRCSIGFANDECESVVMDPAPDGMEEDITASNGYNMTVKHSRSNSWLGGVVVSGSSNSIVTCAHRWENLKLLEDPNVRRNVTSMNGACYVRSKTAMISTDLNPLKNTNPQRLLPLADKAKQIKYNWLGGLAGMSAHITQDNELLLGAPAVGNRQGSAIVYRGNTPQGEFIDRKIFDSSGQQDLIGSNAYFGYAVTSGKFNIRGADSTKVQYVAGAPRDAELRGSVIVFDFASNEDSVVKSLNVIANITEERTGQDASFSYFGSVLCVLDIDGDGYDELLVGAPQQRTSLARIVRGAPPLGGAFFEMIHSGDEGVVHVYTSDKTRLVRRQMLMGDQAYGARFGSAIASVGDLNKDGKQDIAVGAPYARYKDRDEMGAIYIYHGKDDGFESKYSQVILASDLLSPFPLRGFGSSFSATQIDVDGNGYPDLVVGSYLSNHVVVLRSKPFVAVTSRLETLPKKLGFNDTSVTIQYCLKTEGDAAQKGLLRFKVDIALDTLSSRSRLRWRNPYTGRLEKVIQDKDSFSSREKCKTFLVDVAMDQLSHDPIHLKQTYYLLPSSEDVIGPTVYTVTRNPSLIDVTTITGPKFTDFCSDCPQLAVNGSNDHDIHMDQSCGSDAECLADFTLSSNFVGFEEDFIVGSAKNVTLNVTVTSVGDDALGAFLQIKFLRRQLMRIPPKCSSIELQSQRPGEQVYRCALGNPMRPFHPQSFSFIFDTADIAAGDTHHLEQLVFNLEVRSWTNMKAPVSEDVLLPLQYVVKPLITSSSSNVTIVDTGTESKVDETLEHKYEIQLLEPTPIKHSFLVLQVPDNITIGGEKHKALFVFRPEVTLGDTRIHCYAKTGSFFTSASPQNIIQDEREIEELSDIDKDEVILDAGIFKFFQKKHSPRVRRDTGEREGAEEHSRPVNASVLVLNCDHDKIECMQAICRFDRMMTQVDRAEVKLKMKIYMHTIDMLFESHPEIRQIDVETTASLVWDTNGMETNSSVSHIIYLRSPGPSKRWYILGAIIGVIILACLILLLCKCGFFERKKVGKEEPTEESVPLNANGRGRVNQ